MLFWRSIHATVISIVERPAARRLRLLSCQLWVSLQAQWREQESCLCWTAELLPACSLALVSRPVISVSDPSRQPTRTPASQRRVRPERDRCQQPAVPPPPSHARPGRCLLRPGHIFEAEQHGKEGSSLPPIHSRHIARDWSSIRALMSDMEHPPEETVPVQEHYRLGLSPD